MHHLVQTMRHATNETSSLLSETSALSRRTRRTRSVSVIFFRGPMHEKICYDIYNICYDIYSILQVAPNLLIRMHTEDVLVHAYIFSAQAVGGWSVTTNQAVKMWLRHQLRHIFFVESNGDPARPAPSCTFTSTFNPRL